MAIQVDGRRALNGRIWVQGAKNAVLPMMAASLLAKGTTVLEGVPAIRDVEVMRAILESLGCVCAFAGGTLEIDASRVTEVRIPEEFVGRLRSSVMMLGPLLARCKEAVTAYPGGCLLGKRPIDLHLSALTAMGAEIQEAGGVILASCRGLSGTELAFPFPSVGATENALMAAVTAEGTTVIRNCAREPEICELCRFLAAMGAKIAGAGTGCLRIRGVRELSPCRYRVGADRICAGTYLAAAMAASGDVEVCGLPPELLKAPLALMEAMGAEIRVQERERAIRLRMRGRPRGFSVETGPYPEFPTDLQSVFLAVSCIARGTSRLTENVFEARFAAARELAAFGARIRVDGRTAFSEGVRELAPALVRAPDLRGGAALVVAALAAEGLSVIETDGHIERGYEDICRDLRKLGAEVEEIG